MYTSMFRKAMLGDTATLNLDFTTGTLDSRLTFTRSGTGTYINSSGYVTTASTNVARFDYDPATLAPRGLLIEGQATNLIKGSQTIAGTEWSASNPAFTVTANSTDLVAPNNTNTATKLEYVSGYARAVQTNITVAASTTYTISYWIKSTGVCYWKIYDASNGSFIVENVAIAASANWQRVTRTFTTPAGCTSIWAYVADSATSGIYYVWGAQLEAGSGASSYISTTASQATRNADSCIMSNISSLSYSTTNGSMVYHGRFSKINSASYPTRMGFLTNAGGDPAFEIFTNATTIFSGIRSTAANNEITQTIAINTDYKFATAFNASAASQVRCSLNGAAAVGSSTSALTDTRTPTVFGFTRSGYELYFPCGTIKAAKYYNTTLTDAELVSQST